MDPKQSTAFNMRQHKVFTYRYFLHHWPQLCIMAMSNGKAIGCVVCKMEEDGDDPTAIDLMDPDAGATTVQSQHDTTYDNIEVTGNKSDTINTATAQEASNNDATNSYNCQSASKTNLQSSRTQSGYIAMLAVQKSHRHLGIGTHLVKRVLLRMKNSTVSSSSSSTTEAKNSSTTRSLSNIITTSVTLETEVSNVGAQRLYERLGFLREEKLVRYYLNWGDAYRLRLWF